MTKTKVFKRLVSATLAFSMLFSVFSIGTVVKAVDLPGDSLVRYSIETSVSTLVPAAGTEVFADIIVETQGDTPLTRADVFLTYDPAILVRTPGSLSTPTTLSNAAMPLANGSGTDVDNPRVGFSLTDLSAPNVSGRSIFRVRFNIRNNVVVVPDMTTILSLEVTATAGPMPGSPGAFTGAVPLARILGTDATRAINIIDDPTVDLRHDLRQAIIAAEAALAAERTVGDPANFATNVQVWTQATLTALTNAINTAEGFYGNITATTNLQSIIDAIAAINDAREEFLQAYVMGTRVDFTTPYLITPGETRTDLAAGLRHRNITVVRSDAPDRCPVTQRSDLYLLVQFTMPNPFGGTTTAWQPYSLAQFDSVDLYFSTDWTGINVYLTMGMEGHILAGDFAHVWDASVITLP
jgi:hypothetical protein